MSKPFDKLSNLSRALDKLEAFLRTSMPSELERAGIIQGFEFCFELFWKTFKHISEHRGLSAGSPKTALSAAFQQRFFTDETTWLDMLTDRNLTVHIYNESLAEEIHQRIRSRYLPEMRACLAHLRRELSSP